MIHKPRYFEQYSQENASQLVNGAFNPQATVGLHFHRTRSFEHSIVKGQTFQWSATQYGEQPDFILKTAMGNLSVKIEIGLFDLHHQKLYLNHQKEYPITHNTANKIISSLLDQGYIENYFTKNLKITYTKAGILKVGE